MKNALKRAVSML